MRGHEDETALNCRFLIEGAGFEVEKTLESSCGDVFLARKIISSDRMVVVKRVRKSFNKCFEAQEKFLCESHRNVARVLEVIAVSNRDETIVVSEFVGGGDLFHHFQEIGVFPEFLARIYMQDLLTGVLELHKAGICHRDLKPENCVLDANGVLKIIDFGIAARFDDTTIFHDFCGSLEYVAPEILFRKPYCGPAVDVWGCGVMLFEMVVGDVPFVVSESAHVYKFPTALVDEAALSIECVELIYQLLCMDPQKRVTLPCALNSRWILEPYDLTVDDISITAALEQSVVAKRLHAILKEQIAKEL